MEQFTDKKTFSEVERYTALSRISVALMSERDENALLHLIAQTAADLTGASFAAFTLRPMRELDQATTSSGKHLFHLAAVVGVTKEQEALFRRMPLGGEGLLAPIFQQGVPVRVADALNLPVGNQYTDTGAAGGEAERENRFSFMHGGNVPSPELKSVGVPRGHPVIRSFLGAPLLDRHQKVRGGLLLGYPEPNRFTADDEIILQALAAQAAVALDNARLYQQLHMRAQELDAIFESITDGVTLVDEQGHILRENASAQQLRRRLQRLKHGRRMLADMLYKPARSALAGDGAHDLSITIPDDNEEMREYIVNSSRLHQRGNYYDAWLQDRTLADKGPALSEAVVVWHDITESRRLLAEQRARADMESRLSLLQLILDELPSSVYLVYGPDARLVLANHAAHNVWGASWPADTPMVEFLTDNHIRIFKDDGRPLPSEQLATLRSVQNGETIYQHTEVIRRSDGSNLPVLVNAIALDGRNLNIVMPHARECGKLGDGDAMLPAAIVVHQDMTAIKEAEYLKDDFIGIAAHELRNPLAVLHGCAQTLIVQSSRGKGVELSPWQVEAIQDIDQATGRLVELTEDLLDVTRLQGGRLELNLEPADLVALTRRVVKRLQQTSDTHHFNIHNEEEFLVANIDARRIEQVLTNILNNAVKYSPNGGPIDIYLSIDHSPEQALIRVKDTGIGIPARQQARIFERFVRADNAQDIGGTGLGLYLCRELVDRHSGRIWFESVENQGSTFFVTLPLADLS
jgi:Osmosensitive K+ channel histidine kinase